MRELKEDEVTFTLECLPEDMPFEGNCSAIDEETDRAQEKWIRDQLRADNEWAWCCMKVTAKWEGYEGVDYLGCCSYESAADFKQPGGYYDDMKSQALEALNLELSEVVRKGKMIEALLADGERVLYEARDHEWRAGRGGTSLVFASLDAARAWLAQLPDDDREHDDWRWRRLVLRADGCYAGNGNTYRIEELE